MSKTELRPGVFLFEYDNGKRYIQIFENGVMVKEAFFGVSDASHLE